MWNVLAQQSFSLLTFEGKRTPGTEVVFRIGLNFSFPSPSPVTVLSVSPLLPRTLFVSPQASLKFEFKMTFT